MTIKEASERFGIDEKEIKKRKNDSMIIGIHKKGKYLIIPDNTLIIPSKNDIRCFLFEILKHKNNPNNVFSRRLCPDIKSFQILLKYLYDRGFIGDYIFDENITQTLTTIMLTDEGINYVIGNANINKMNNYNIFPLKINPSINIGLINIG